MLVFWTGFWCGFSLTVVLLFICLRILSVRIHNLLIKDVSKAALICNHQHHWKLQFLIPTIWVLQVMSRCFAVLRLEERARGTKLESGSKSSCGLGSEGKYPSNSTKQRLPRCIYLFFLPLNICSGSSVEFWVLSLEFIVSWTPSLFGAIIVVPLELQSLQLLALFWGAFARVKKNIYIWNVSRLSRLPGLEWTFSMGLLNYHWLCDTLLWVEMCIRWQCSTLSRPLFGHAFKRWVFIWFLFHTTYLKISSPIRKHVV